MERYIVCMTEKIHRGPMDVMPENIESLIEVRGLSRPEGLGAIMGPKVDSFILKGLGSFKRRIAKIEDVS